MVCAPLGYSLITYLINCLCLYHAAVSVTIDREFVTSAKKNSQILTNFPKLKKIRKNSYKNSLNARVGVAFQWNSLLI